jgi:dTMP kinase
LSTPFISLDGLDGTGKSTQCRLLADWLRGLGVSVTNCVDPGGTELGSKLREILLFGREQKMTLRTEALLFMASRAELVGQIIRPALDLGEVVVSDRFILANVVYQGHAGGLNPDELWAVGRMSTAGLEPDLTLVLDLPVEVAQVRRGRSADRMERRADDYHERVRQGFLSESARRPDRITVIDATSSVDDVQRQIRRAVSPLLRERGYPIPGEV